MKLATSISSLALLASAVSGCIYKRSEGAPEWSYAGGATGPLVWHTLHGYEKCGTGSNQSPINILPSTLTSLPGVSLQYPVTGDFEAHNNGHTIQLTPLEYADPPVYAKSPYSASLGNNTYKLSQFHFHTPSEHQLDGVSYPMEVHFVHTCPETGALAVVGLFIDVDYQSAQGMFEKLAPPVTKRILGGGIREIKEKDQKTEIKSLPLRLVQEHLKVNGAYHYAGSLTTPPCTEEIKWYVSAAPLKVSVGEYLAFKEILKFNSRYTQNAPGSPNLLESACDVELSDVELSDIDSEFDSDSDSEDEAEQ